MGLKTWLGGLAAAAMVAPCLAIAGPSHPPSALPTGVTGVVTIMCVVQPDRSLRGCRVVRETPPDYGLGHATIEASRKFRMRPGRKNEAHVGAVVKVTVKWRDDGEPEFGPLRSASKEG